jgi:hypothetical protein
MPEMRKEKVGFMILLRREACAMETNQGFSSGDWFDNHLEIPKHGFERRDSL